MTRNRTAGDPAPAYRVTVHPEEIVQPDFLGIGVNLIPTALMPNNAAHGYREALWEVDRGRIAQLRPAVARVWFQIDWMETEPGCYTWDSPKMQGFYAYLDVLQQAGTEVELNFGWKNGRDIQEWFAFEGAPGRISAPRDLAVFGRSASALLHHLVDKRGYDNVKYLTFYNEPAGDYDFETPSGIGQVGYYEQMARAVHDQLVEDGLRDRVELWGPEEWSAPDWTEYMARVGSDVFDLYSFHVYAGTYSTLSEEIAKRSSQARGEIGLTEFGFPGDDQSGWDAGYANYVIKLANEGVKVGLVWQLNGVWLEDPDEEVDANGTYTLWDSLVVTDVPNRRYYEVGMLMRWIPAHSTVVRTHVSAAGVRAATFRTEAGDVTMVVEVDDSPGPRTIDIDLGADPERPVGVMQYNEQLVPDGDALLPRVVRTHLGRRFTDTVGGRRHVLVYTTLNQPRPARR